MAPEVDKADRVAAFRARTVAATGRCCRGIHRNSVVLAIRKNHTGTLGLVGQ